MDMRVGVIDMDAKQKAELNRFLKFIRMYRKTIDSESSLQKFQTLLTIAVSPGISQASLIREQGISRGAASKNIMDFTDLTSKKRPGPGLVDTRPDPMERRSRLLSLTPKGETVIKELLEKL